ncbi:MAG: hypothetical protein ACK5M3_10290 [Dysgonomonas sp.]
MKIRLVITTLLFGTLSAFAQKQVVDYRYAPQWHETSISLADDTCKTVVGHLGQLLYEYERSSKTKEGKFYPYANNQGFRTIIHLYADDNVKLGNQHLYSAKVPIVITEGTYDGMQVTQEAFAVGMDYVRKGISTRNGNREDIILTTVENKTSETKTIRPVLIVDSERDVKVDGRVVTIHGNQQVIVSEDVIKVRKNLVSFKTLLELSPIEVPAGGKKLITLLYDNAKTSRLAQDLKRNKESLNNNIASIRQEMIDYWENKTDIPYGYVSVPDKEIQDVLDASLRGIWQAREIKDGNISFQVGPTCYRGLWIVDGAFLLEAATLFNRGQDARHGIEYILSFQEEDGKFAKMTKTYWKENGIVLWTCIRHAMLTQDKVWLKSIWPKLMKTTEFIKKLRAMSYQNDIPLDDGLMPPGDIDGGLWGGKDQAEYTNIYWNLAGLKAMIQAAKWIGEKKDAKALEKEYADFNTVFQKAAKRDLIDDLFGNKFLPVTMDPKFHSLPQRAQWAFCQAVYPGQIFEPNDPIATGTLDMLHTTLQEGVVMGTGWMEDGIWTYFASFYGHACLWMGEAERASQSLYAFANHASPLYTWREEQNPRDLEPKYWGDMPHNWGSAEFARLVVHLLALDRGNELHLLEGVPKEWLGAGMETKLNEIATPFGKLNFELKVADSGKQANLRIDKMTDKSCKGVFVHLGKWGSYNGADLVKLDSNKENNITIELK